MILKVQAIYHIEKMKKLKKKKKIIPSSYVTCRIGSSHSGGLVEITGWRPLTPYFGNS